MYARFHNDCVHHIGLSLLLLHTSAGSVDCDQGPQLYTDLQVAAESLVVANHLHMLYLVTPYDMLSTHLQPNWMLYLDEVWFV